MARRSKKLALAVWLAVLPVLPAGGQGEPPPRPPAEGRPDERGGAAPGDRGGSRPGGMGGPMGQQRNLVKQFDKDGDGRLNTEERQVARANIKQERERGGAGRGGPRGPFGGREQQPGKPGPRIAQDQAHHPNASLYEPSVLRTLFIDFENADWEAELDDFRNTDVEVPATLTVDGKKYPGVGLRFRGASSLFTVPLGSKRSLNLAIDHTDEKQRLHGYKTLNLLNAHSDPSFLHTVLYSHIARQYLPAPRANLVKVVINGESWGVYVNTQQFDKKFLEENYGGSKGTRWKTPGSPRGGGSLAYLGEKVEDYKRFYEIKSGENEKAWTDLIALCRTLDQTPPEKLREALEPILDIDKALWMLALENALINGDGYWIRTSDYSIYQDDKGKFHLMPHDMNEAFQPSGGGPGGMGRPGGRGRGGPGGQGGPGAPGGAGGNPARGNPPGNNPGGAAGPANPGGPPAAGGPPAGGRGGSIQLDPLVAAQDKSKPLISRLLAVPALRERYLQHVRTIAHDWLDWEKLGPVAETYHLLIKPEIEADTRKLSSMTDFNNSLFEQPGETFRRNMSIQAFAKQRREYLLDHAEIKKLPEGK